MQILFTLNYVGSIFIKKYTDAIWVSANPREQFMITKTASASLQFKK